MTSCSREWPATLIIILIYTVVAHCLQLSRVTLADHCLKAFCNFAKIVLAVSRVCPCPMSRTPKTASLKNRFIFSERSSRFISTLQLEWPAFLGMDEDRRKRERKILFLRHICSILNHVRFDDGQRRWPTESLRVG